MRKENILRCECLLPFHPQELRIKGICVFFYILTFPSNFSGLIGDNLSSVYESTERLWKECGHGKERLLLRDRGESRREVTFPKARMRADVCSFLQGRRPHYTTCMFRSSGDGYKEHLGRVVPTSGISAPAKISGASLTEEQQKC